MSCWVVPSIAAELWGVNVQDVHTRINDQSLPSKFENGFTFVDVAPDSPRIETPLALRTPPPPTYRVVSREEIVALLGEAAFEDEQELGDWRIGRREAGRMRRPPEAIAA